MKRRRWFLALSGICGLVLLTILLGNSPDAPAPPSPPEEEKAEVIAVEPPAPAPAEAAMAAPYSAPHLRRATLLVRGVGRPAPRFIHLRGGTEEVVSTAAHGDGLRRVELSGLPAGTQIEIAATGFLPARVVLEGDPPTAEAVLRATAQLVVGDAEQAGQTYEIRRIGEEEDRTGTFTAPGSTEFADLAAGTHEFEVLARERLPLGRFEVALDWGERKRVDLSERELGVVVRGRTVNPDGQVVAKAKVTVRSDGLPEGAVLAEVEVRSDSRGEFRVRLRPEIPYSFRGEKPGYGPRDPPVVRVTAATPTVMVVLSTDTNLFGKVVDEEGAPLPGIDVEAFRQLERDGSWSDRRRHRVTDEEGRFRFDDLPAGWLVRLTVKGEGRALPDLPYVRIEPGVPEQVIVLRAEHRFEVKVISEADGQPISGVRFNGDRRLEVLGPGRYRIGGYARGEPVVLNLSSDGGFSRKRWRGTADGPVVVELRPTGDVTMEGRVVDDAGNPVARARISGMWIDPRRRSRDESRYHSIFATAGRDGRFTFRHLREGARYTVHAEVVGMSGVVAASYRNFFTATPGQDITLVVRGVGGFFCRPVWPGAADPETKVMVQFDRPEGDHWPYCPLVGGGDRIAVKGIPAGSYDITIRAGGCVPVVLRDVEIHAGQRTDGGDVRLLSGAPLEVVLRDAAGQPLVGWGITVLQPGESMRHGFLTGKNGRSKVQGALGSGEWLVLATAESGGPAILLGTVTVTEYGPQIFEATVPEPAMLAVTVRDARGRPSAGVVVEVLAEAAPPLDRLLTYGWRAWGWWQRSPDLPARIWSERQFVTDAEGRFEVDSLSPGPYRVRVGAREIPVTLSPGGQAEVVVD